ncbi:TetR/AcrR family transcriptional regulator [Pseudomonas sp. N040]|uniref:TetR/AcrR family transcriptional regulator n=1 Tax=Pseudomonas sp. N040 TaxID=2785325 RepID=UPI0018A24E93|nr:TetR/AcrR family transcriptional regulator [Pseudomonas sp. N040]MBF7730466.1 TetR/AcrR family transcriptional regulator [Pseudomonas sp. N040]MBW7014109.1 TetR/AcrR family transcriptional regulator [Pseudomonas sp. N040]
MNSVTAAPAHDSADQPLTRGHKKRARTRQALIEAALRIYAHKGVGELALNELAAEAEVSNGTVYNYFTTREEVLSAVGVALIEQFSSLIDATMTGIEPAPQRVAIAMRMLIERAFVDPDWAAAIVRVMHFDEGMRSAAIEFLRADLQAGLRQGAFSYSDEQVALELFISITLGGLRSVVEGRAAPDRASKTAEMTLRALGVPAEAARYFAFLPLPEAKALVEATPVRRRGRPPKTARSD